MKSYRKELCIHTRGGRAFVNITPRVESALAESGGRDGLCLVNPMRITASVFVNLRSMRAAFSAIPAGLPTYPFRGGAMSRAIDAMGDAG